MELKKVTKSAEETRRLGYRLAELATAGMVFAMSGDLGAGKTTITQGIAKGLGITRTVSSPTFTILKIYKGRMPLYHFDAYRLENADQDLGFEEMIDGDGLTVVEWPMYMRELAGVDVLKIEFHRLDEDVREITFKAESERYQALLEEL